MSKTKTKKTTPALPRGNINIAAIDALLAEHGH